MRLFAFIILSVIAIGIIIVILIGKEIIMMKKMKLGASAVLLMLGVGVFAQSTMKVDITPFPKADKGMKQVVIEVPHSNSDSNKKIEIFVGKTMQTDGCNKVWLSGEFVSKELQGWGYNYLTFKTNGATPSTLMACPNAQPKDEFVKSQGYLTDYNGRMPIVLYIPEGYDAKFRIYKADRDLFNAQEIRVKTK